MDKLTLPNLLSASRLALAIPSFLLIRSEAWLFSAIVILLAVTADMADGYLARRRRQVSTFGGLLDHGSDAIFVTATLAALALSGMVPWILPPLVGVAFIQYTLDSRALSGQPLRASRVGRYNGIAYFVLAGFPSMQHALGFYPVAEDYFMWAGWILVISTIISMSDRGIAVIRKLW
ncbi:MAG: CDP-alcohol phosphatidyltransferase family protein [Pseudomonadales bacterium]